MKRNSLLFLLLLALLAPWTANAQTLFSEGFEGGSMPTGWSQDGPNTWSVGSGDYSASTGAGQGTYNALITHVDRGNVTKLITPEIDLSSVTSATLSFMHIQRSWAGDIDELRVYYRTSSTGTWTQLVAYTDAISSWTTEEDIMLPNTSATYQLAFEHTDNYGYGVGLDQIVISAPSACPKPTLGPAEYISEESASFQWTENGSATQWQLQYSTSADFANPTTIDRSGIPALVVRDLSSGTTYYFRVRSSCSVGEYSDWSNVVSFHTLCQTYSLPYAYGFEDAGDLDCWTVDYTANTPGINSDEAHAGSNCFRFSSYNNASSYDQYLISPAFNDAGSKEFSFYYKPYSSGTEKFTVGYSTTTNETSAFTWGDEIVTTAGNDWTLYEATYPAGTKYVAIHYYSNYAYYLYVDDFNFDISSGCSKPTDLALTASTTTITATWNGTADTYNIDINGTVTNNVTSPYTFTGEFATIYTVMVQANCGGGETSGWTNPQNVATDLCAPEDMCELTFELTDSYGDGWNGAYISIVDATSGIEIAQMSADDHGNVASTDTKTLAVCNGRVINFVWVGGSYDSETSYVVKDINGEVIFSGAAGDGLITNYTVNCTPPACPKPKNLAVEADVTSANISWVSDNDNIELWWREKSLGAGNDFENGMGKWTTIDADGDGYNWELGSVAMAGYVIPSHDGEDCATSKSYDFDAGGALTPDNYLVSPQITLGGSISFWACAQDPNYPEEHFGVAVSTTSNTDASAFTTIQEWTMTAKGGRAAKGNHLTRNRGNREGSWYQYTVDLSAYSGQGYVAIRHFDCTDMFYLNVDGIEIVEPDQEENTWNEVNPATNPYALTDLRPVTTYEVQVRALCGEDGESDWVYTTFTTLSNCDAPTNLEAAPMPESATLTWEGSQENYNVQYRKVAGEVTIFEDGFENGLDNWTIYTQGETPNDEGWVTYDASNLNNATNHSGSYVVSAWSWAADAYDADNWLVTPQIDIQGTLKFWETTAANWPDSYEVLLSTSGNSISDFTITLREMQQATGDWSEVTIDLSSYAGQQGYIAIHHVSYDANYLFIDDFSITATQEAGEWISATSSTNSLNITDLESETEYEWQVQGINAECDGGVTAWSEIATFTTPDACAVPTDLTAEVTGNAAELSWTGTTETYNLQYREVDPSVPATIILNIPADVWGDGSGYQMLLDADATAYGTIFPETGALTESGDASEETYAEFEYKLPTDADGSCSTSNILVEGRISLEIPAGTYDWCITNPTPDDRIWIASSNGNVGGRQDDYVFEPGTTYEFTIYLGGSNDAVDVTITDNNEWTLFEGVNNPYTLENLSAQTTYKYKVQGVDCDGNGGTTDWSANATFTTGEFYTKHIKAYSSEEGVNDGWYFIASPVDATVTPSESNGFLTNDYDLYYFNQNGDTDGMEWINHEVESFDIENGNGYLYANSQDVDLIFTGTAYSGTTKDVTLTYSTDNADDNMHGWNLVGNPFAEIAYINMPFYTLDGGSEYDEKAAGEAINPMQGVLVHTDAEATLTFSTTPINKNARLMLNLTQGRNIMDRAIVCFNESKPLPKKQLRDNSTKVYFPIDSKDYAVVSADNQGEMPVSFKAEKNGTYTLSINAEDVEFGYLHLIDNMTGNDVDLLSTPSYSFEAKTTDYASRFRLVFSANSNSDNFAFFNGTNWTVSNEGDAILQVMDVTGRMISSENINGNANININAAQGVYMLRLVNGENVKVQKVVVR